MSVLSRSITTDAVSIAGRDGSVMFGVLSRPAAQSGPVRAVIFCRAGFQAKTGTGDLHKHMADVLAAAGFHVLRVDQAGTGDSPGEFADAVPVDDYFAAVRGGAFQEDTELAIAWMRRTHAPAALYLVGASSGCVSALLAAAAAPGAVDGLVLMTPPVLVRAPRAASAGAGSYRQRLFDPRLYRKVLTGAADYSVIAAVAAAPFARLRAGARRLRGLVGGAGRPTHPHFSAHFWGSFQALMQRRTPLLFLLAERDAETDTFVAEFQTPILKRRAEYRRLCTVQFLPETDHDLTSDSGRQAALDAIRQWLSLRSHQTAGDP